ncbi:GDYXXLXY domain-containing protein [Psychroserpens mesophilus]|uniref:GDYXXLXY domain-containing protein n=1 Tax=Psychroserpens mesophilus TaxID=325473 RepID=UPI003D65913C
MKTTYIFILFIILAIAQISIPAQMIYHRETILKEGKAFKFKTEPIDPADPFKGKYIHLNYELNSFKTDSIIWKPEQDMYISISNDSLGFAKANTVHKQIPKQGDFVLAKVNWYNSNTKEVRFTFPFNEFYMEENKAYDAEIAHRDAQRDSLPNNTYAVVYIKEGQAVLNNVFINDIPIAEYVEQ